MRYDVAPFRRPFEANSALVAVLLPGIGILVVAALLGQLGLRGPWLLLPGAALGLLGAVAVLYADHRLHPAGCLRIDDGILRWDGWRGRKVEVAVAEISKILVVRYGGARPDVLVLWLPSGRLYLHEVRLGGVTLDQVAADLRAAMPPEQGAAVDGASAATATRQAKIARVAAVASALAVAITLLRLLLEHAGR
jgi:hypothetical protein